MTQMTLKMTFLLAGSALVLAACGGDEKDTAKPDTEMKTESVIEDVVEVSQDPADDMEPMEVVSLDDVLMSEDLRSSDAMARDEFRNPVQTLAFFGLEPDMTVVEIWPGGGWYTDILAPYLASGGGKLVAAHFEGGSEYQDSRLAKFSDKYMGGGMPYGDVELAKFGPTSGPIATSGSADMVVTFRNVHNWKMNGFADRAFDDFYDVLKPGGVLGVVEHRLPEEYDTALEDSSGYMKQSSVIAMAEASGFEFVEESEINANPDDTADHPFGVWTLPPSSRTSARDGSVPDDFDADFYKAVGESDRMTLKFRKPIDADGALLE